MAPCFLYFKGVGFQIGLTLYRWKDFYEYL